MLPEAGCRRGILKKARGPVAQLGARFHGMEEVEGSNPSRSTKPFWSASPESIVCGFYAQNGGKSGIPPQFTAQDLDAQAEVFGSCAARTRRQFRHLVPVSGWGSPDEAR